MSDPKNPSTAEQGNDDVMKKVVSGFSMLNVGGSAESDKQLADLSLKGLIEHWKTKGFKNIITMVGAGISTSAGIPDFRTPGSGLYDNLKKYKLPNPSSIFSIQYFRRKPQAFFALAKELYPGTVNPTPAHYFVRLLHEKGILLRHYTQNIDSLDRVAGIPDHKLVEAHGTFTTNHCLSCRRSYPMEWMKEQIFADNVPRCERCKGIVKPDIVFYGEQLQTNFERFVADDFPICDLLIIMGTSLEVMPFAGLIENVPPQCVRLLINRDRVGRLLPDGLMYDRPGNTRDVAYIGNADEGVREVAEKMGWGKEFNELIKRETSCLANEREEERAAVEPSTSSGRNA